MRLTDPLLTEQMHNPDAPLYRSRTMALLNKYLRMSIELGHLPVLMGMQFFRSHVSHYTTHSFEDTAIFVHDVEQALRALPKRHQEVITTLFFLQYTIEEAAPRMNVCPNTLHQWRTEAVDALTTVFLQRQLLKRLPFLPVERLDGDEPSNIADSSSVPKKGPKSVKTIHAVAFSA